MPGSGGADFEGFAEGLHGKSDAVDFGGVAEVGEAVDGLRRSAQAAGEFCGADVLVDHFIQQQDLGGEAGGELNKNAYTGEWGTCGERVMWGGERLLRWWLFGSGGGNVGDSGALLQNDAAEGGGRDAAGECSGA